MKDEENIGMLAVCDVYKKRADKFQSILAEKGIDVKSTQDYKEVLDMKDLDYVVVSVPEHSHYHVSMDALDAGKHVYVEKPMTHTVEESRNLVAKTRKTGLKVQVGVQGMSDDSYINAYKAIKAGKIGKVVEAEIEYCRWHPLDRGPWRRDIDEDMAKPADLDWNAWLGPAPERPWSAPRYFEWRNYRDYSGGVGTDLFVHRISRILKATGQKFPVRAVGMGGIYLWPDGRELPDNFEMLLEYPAVGDYCNGMTVRVLGTLANDNPPRHIIRGQQGSIVFTDEGFKIVSEPDHKVIETFKKTSHEDFTPHHKNHHAAIRDGKELVCPVDLGYQGLVAIRMGNLSWFEKKMMTWDEKNEVIKPA
jgi:predicted dehydrogenase